MADIVLNAPIGEGQSAVVWLGTRGGQAEVFKLAKPGHDETLLTEAEHALFVRDPALPELRSVGRFLGAQGPVTTAQAAHEPVVYTGWAPIPGRDASEFTDLSPHDIAVALRDVARALARLHDAELSHGDVKPANIRVALNEGRAWLLDLGLASQVSARLPQGATPRYLEPDLGRSDGRARDLFALGISLVELLEPAARTQPEPRSYLQEPTEATPLARGLWRLAAELVSDLPGYRPAAHWVWRRACQLLGEPDPGTLPAPEQVKASYLLLRRAELMQAATEGVEFELSPPVLGWVETTSALRQAIASCRSATGVGAPERLHHEPASGPTRGGKLRFCSLSASGLQRWLIQLIGPDAVHFPALGLTEPELAERLLALCSQFPAPSIGAAELSAAASTPRQPPPSNLQQLALRLSAKPDPATLLAGELLVAGGDAEPRLVAALAHALRRRTEHARAVAVLEPYRLSPLCAAELAECARRMGDHAQCEELAGQVVTACSAPTSADSSSLGETHAAVARTKASLARVALSRQDVAAAAAALAGAPASAQVAEAQALLQLELHGRGTGDLEQADSAIVAGLALAETDEDFARLLAVKGYLEHRRGAAKAAVRAFGAAVEHASRASAVYEEAIYLTGLAAAASDAGLPRRALLAAERSSLIFRRLGELSHAARAQLNQAVALQTCADLGQARRAAEQAAELAERSGDDACAASSSLCLAEISLASDENAESTDLALLRARRASTGSPDERLLLGALELKHAARRERLHAEGYAARIGELDRVASGGLATAGSRLAWWEARASVLLNRPHSGHDAGLSALGHDALGYDAHGHDAHGHDAHGHDAHGPDAPGHRALGRGDEVLRELLALAPLPAPVAARGPALTSAARLAAQLGDGDAARLLFIAARQCLVRLTRNLPPALQASFASAPWVRTLESWVGPGGKAGDPASEARAEAQLHRLEQLVRGLSGRGNLRALLDQVLDALVLWTGVERGLLLLAAPNDKLRIRAARNLSRQDLSADQRQLSMTLARRALLAREPVVAVDARGELPELSASVHALNLRSVLAVPLLARGEALGVVYLDDRDRRGAFGESELAWVRLVGGIAAIAIAEARDQLLLRRAARRAERASSRLQRSLEQEKQKLVVASRQLEQRPHPEFVGHSPPLRRLVELVTKVADTNLPVLILGESGTGKELVARAIHADSPRAARAFVVENCAAVPESLLESTLFGHVRGAFTGADRNRVGLFELADGGSLFLDELGEMSLGMQAKLLRVIETGEVRAVGGSKSTRVDVRVVAATHQDLKAMAASGQFRTDLMYRLDVFNIAVPPLRERREDIRDLALHFLALHGKPGGGGVGPRFSPAAVAALEGYAWPGNVRQLENEVRRALVLSDGLIEPFHFSAELTGADNLRPGGSLKQATERLELRLVSEALADTGGNLSQAAKQLGVSRYGLQKMLRRLGIDNSKAKH